MRSWKLRLRRAGLMFALALCATQVTAWDTVGDGIEYQHFTTPEPNHIYVARMSRANLNATLESTIANGTQSGATETVKNQAARYDDALSWWGQEWGKRNDVVVAVNGDFWNVNTKVVTGGQVHSGWYSNRWSEWGGYSGFGWTVNRLPFIGGCVHHPAQEQFVTFLSTGSTANITDVNRARSNNELILYTPQYNNTTLTDATGVEVVVEVTRPALIIAAPNKVVGYIRQIRQNSGSTPIPFDCVVLSGKGTAATALLANATVGAEVWICQNPYDYNQPDTSGQYGCAYRTSVDWQKTFAAVGVNYRFLENGAVRAPDPAYSGYAGLVVRNPRTAVAYNADYVFFIVVDGRSEASLGMTVTAMANWCRTILGATDGANLDGGGSSTMVVNGTVMNVPSDGPERAVANGIMMVNLAPKLQSTRFAVGQTVATTASTNLRLGPGTNYGIITTLPANASGAVLDTTLRGINAKGYYWWKVAFTGFTGWVAESLLTESGPPVITQDPTAASVCLGASADFTCAATGPGTLTYRWQKNGANISNGGHYSGATTPTLTVTGADSSDAASYRCMVSNAFGAAYTTTVQLTLLQTPPSAVTVTDEGDYTPSLSTLSAWWTQASPGCSTVSFYEYAVGTTAASQDVRGWTAAGSGTYVEATGLTLSENNDYFIQVRAVDSAGRTGAAASADGIAPALAVSKISDLWALPNATSVSLRGKAVTASIKGYVWLEEADRSSAIRVLYRETAVNQGAVVDVAGVMAAWGDTTRVLTADVLHDTGTTLAVQPLGMVSRDLGGASVNAWTPGVTGGSSLYNVGLLVTVSGNVTHFDSSNPLYRFFYIDDGSGLHDGLAAGLRVECYSAAPPEAGMVVVTGILATRLSGESIVPVLLVRDPLEIRPV